MEIIIGYLASAIIGISLGLIGGGGSILTVPVLVYLFHVDPVLATAYSLFIVGVSSSVGAMLKLKTQEIDRNLTVIFGLPLLLTVFVFRKFLVPLIPNQIWNFHDFVLTKSDFILTLFGLLMVLAALSLLSSPKTSNSKITIHPFFLGILGIGIGSISGLLGAGGGFIIIPALMIFGHLEMKKAVGISLVIVAISSLIGFTGDLSHTTMNWQLLGIVTAIAVIGVFVGHFLASFVSGVKLKHGFGWFIMVMGSLILIMELFF